MQFGIARECRSCGREMAAYQSRCIHCDGRAGFQFPWLHAIGIGVFVAGALLYHSNSNIAATIMRLAGYDIAPE